MSTRQKRTNFLLQTLTIIAIICLSIPSSAFAITTPSGTKQAESGMYKQSSYNRESQSDYKPATGGNTKPDGVGVSGYSKQPTGGNTQSGYKPATGGLAPAETRDGRGGGGNGQSGYSNKNNGGDNQGSSGGGGSNGNSGGDGSNGQSAGGGIMSKISQIASATRAALSGGIQSMKDVADSARRTLSKTPDGGGYGDLPGPTVKPTYFETPRDDRAPSKSTVTNAQVPNNIAQDIADKKATETYVNNTSYLGMTDAQREKLKTEFEGQLEARREGVDVTKGKAVGGNRSIAADTNSNTPTPGCNINCNRETDTADNKRIQDYTINQAQREARKKAVSEVSEARIALEESQNTKAEAFRVEQLARAERGLAEVEKNIAFEKKIAAYKKEDKTIKPPTLSTDYDLKKNAPGTFLQLPRPLPQLVNAETPSVPSVNTGRGKDLTAEDLEKLTQQIEYNKILSTDTEYKNAKATGDERDVDATQRVRDATITAYNQKYPPQYAEQGNGPSDKMVKIMNDPKTAIKSQEAITRSVEGVKPKTTITITSATPEPQGFIESAWTYFFPPEPKIEKIVVPTKQTDQIVSSADGKIVAKPPTTWNEWYNDLPDIREVVKKATGLFNLTKIVQPPPSDTFGPRAKITVNGPGADKPLDPSLLYAVDTPNGEIKPKDRLVTEKLPGKTDDQGTPVVVEIIDLQYTITADTIDLNQNLEPVADKEVFLLTPGVDAPAWTATDKINDFAGYVPSSKQAQEDPDARPAGINNRQTDYERILNADKKYQEVKVTGDVAVIGAAQKERDKTIVEYNTKYPAPKPVDTSVKLISTYDDSEPKPEVQIITTVQTPPTIVATLLGGIISGTIPGIGTVIPAVKIVTNGAGALFTGVYDYFAVGQPPVVAEKIEVPTQKIKDRIVGDREVTEAEADAIKYARETIQAPDVKNKTIYARLVIDSDRQTVEEESPYTLKKQIFDRITADGEERDVRTNTNEIKVYTKDTNVEVPATDKKETAAHKKISMDPDSQKAWEDLAEMDKYRKQNGESVFDKNVRGETLEDTWSYVAELDKYNNGLLGFGEKEKITIEGQPFFFTHDPKKGEITILDQAIDLKDDMYKVKSPEGIIYRVEVKDKKAIKVTPEVVYEPPASFDDDSLYGDGSDSPTGGQTASGPEEETDLTITFSDGSKAVVGTINKNTGELTPNNKVTLTGSDDTKTFVFDGKEIAVKVAGGKIESLKLIEPVNATKTIQETVDEAIGPQEGDTEAQKLAKQVAREFVPRKAIAVVDASIRLFGRLFGWTGSGAGNPPGDNCQNCGDRWDPSMEYTNTYQDVDGDGKLSTGDRVHDTGGSNSRQSDNNLSDKGDTVDASQFTSKQNADTLVNKVLTLTSSNITAFIPSLESEEAKAGLIRRITTTISNTTYVVELRSKLTLSEKFIVIKATQNLSGAKVTFTYTDNGPDGSLDTFSANGVNLSGFSISSEVRKKFEEELRTLTNMYYKSL